MECDPQNWVYDYQGIIGGGLALISALATMALMHSHRKNSLVRRNWSERALAVSALSEIVGYCKHCEDYSIKLLNAWRIMDKPSLLEKQEHKDKFLEIQKTLPSYPTNAFEQFARLVETANHKDARNISDFLTTAQLAEANYESFIVNRVGSVDQDITGFTFSENGFYNLLFDAVTMYEFASRLFPYVRDVKTGEISKWTERPTRNPFFKYGAAFLTEIDWYEYVKTQSWPPASPTELNKLFMEVNKSVPES
jgi:hypothetical protein